MQKIREVQHGQDLKNEILALVDTQLQTVKAQIEASMEAWSGSIVQGCQELEDRIDGIQVQLEEIQQRQDGHQHLFDGILPRLE